MAKGDEWLELRVRDAPHAELALALLLAFLIQMTTKGGAIAWLRVFLEEQLVASADRTRILGTVRANSTAGGLGLTFEPRLDDLHSLVMMRIVRQLAGVQRRAADPPSLTLKVPVGNADPPTIARQLLETLRASSSLVDGHRTIDGVEAVRTAIDALEPATS